MQRLRQRKRERQIQIRGSSWTNSGKFPFKMHPFPWYDNNDQNLAYVPLCNSWRKCLITSYCTKPPSLDGFLDGSLDDNNYPDLAFVSLCNPRKPHYQILTIFTNCKCTILIFVIIFIIYVHAETNSLKISKLKSIARWIYFLENVSDHITQADLGFYLGGLVGLAEIYTMRICRKLTLLKLSKNKKWSSGVWSDLPKNLCLQGNLLRV